MTETSTSITLSTYAPDMFSPLQFCEVVQEGQQLHLQQQHQQYAAQQSVANQSPSNVTSSSNNMLVTTLVNSGPPMQQQAKSHQEQHFHQQLPHQQQQQVLVASPHKGPSPTFTSSTLLAPSSLPLPTPPPHHMSPTALAPSPLHHHHQHHLHQLHLHHHPHHLHQHHQQQLQPMQTHQVHPHHHHHLHPHHLYPHQHQLQMQQQQQQQQHMQHHHQQQQNNANQHMHQQQQAHIQSSLQASMHPQLHMPPAPLKTKTSSLKQQKNKQNRSLKNKNTSNDPVSGAKNRSVDKTQSLKSPTKSSSTKTRQNISARQKESPSKQEPPRSVSKAKNTTSSTNVSNGHDVAVQPLSSVNSSTSENTGHIKCITENQANDSTQIKKDTDQDVKVNTIKAEGYLNTSEVKTAKYESKCMKGNLISDAKLENNGDLMNQTTVSSAAPTAVMNAKPEHETVSNPVVQTTRLETPLVPVLLAPHSSMQMSSLQLLTPLTSSMQPITSQLATIQATVQPVTYQPSLLTLQLPSSQCTSTSNMSVNEPMSISPLSDAFKLSKSGQIAAPVLSSSASKIVFLQPDVKSIHSANVRVSFAAAPSINTTVSCCESSAKSSIASSISDSSECRTDVLLPATSSSTIPSSNATSSSSVSPISTQSNLATSHIGNRQSLSSPLPSRVLCHSLSSVTKPDLSSPKIKAKVSTRSVCIGTDTPPESSCEDTFVTHSTGVSVSTNTSPPNSPQFLDRSIDEDNSNEYYNIHCNESAIVASAPNRMDNRIGSEKNPICSPSFPVVVSLTTSSTLSANIGSNSFNKSNETVQDNPEPHCNEEIPRIPKSSIQSPPTKSNEAEVDSGVSSEHFSSEISTSNDSNYSDCTNDQQLKTDVSAVPRSCDNNIAPDGTANVIPVKHEEHPHKDEEITVLSITPGIASTGDCSPNTPSSPATIPASVPVPVKRTWRRPWKKKKEREKKKKPARKVRRSKPRRRVAYHRTQVVHIDARNGPPIDTTKTVVSRQSEEHIEALKQKRQRIKLNRNSGREYVNRLGKVVQARKIGKPCNCPMKCWDRMGSKVVVIFNNFWDLCDFNLQNSYLFTCLKLCDVKRRYTKKPAEESRRQNTFEYFVRISGKHVRVCKRAFMSAHGLTSDKRLRTLLSQMKDGALLPVYDRRGKHLRPMKPNESSIIGGAGVFTSAMHSTPTSSTATSSTSSSSTLTSKKRTRVSSSTASTSAGNKRKPSSSRGDLTSNLNVTSKGGVYPPPTASTMLHGVVPHCTVASAGGLSAITTVTPAAGAVLHPPSTGHANPMQEPPHSYIPNGELYFPSHYLDPSQGMSHINQISPQCQKMLEAPAYFMAGMKENTFHQ